VGATDVSVFRHPRECAAIDEKPHEALDQALAVALTFLREADPFISFCGLPHEAQQGFALDGYYQPGHGSLIFQRPDVWILRWKSPSLNLNEEWAANHRAEDSGTSAMGA